MTTKKKEANNHRDGFTNEEKELTKNLVNWGLNDNLPHNKKTVNDNGFTIEEKELIKNLAF